MIEVLYFDVACMGERLGNSFFSKNNLKELDRLPSFYMSYYHVAYLTIERGFF